LLSRLEALVAEHPASRNRIEDEKANLTKYSRAWGSYHPDHCRSSALDGVLQSIHYVGLEAPRQEDYQDDEGRPARVVSYSSGSEAMSAYGKTKAGEDDVVLLGTVGRCVAYHSLVRGDVPLAMHQIATMIGAVTENARAAGQAIIAARGGSDGEHRRRRLRASELQDQVQQQVAQATKFIAWLSLGMPGTRLLQDAAAAA